MEKVKKIASWVLGAPLAFGMYQAFWACFYYDLAYFIVLILLFASIGIVYAGKNNNPFLASAGIGILLILLLEVLL